MKQYTVKEIDEMRSDIRRSSDSWVTDQGLRNLLSESMLQTYVLNGTDPKELRDGLRYG